MDRCSIASGWRCLIVGVATGTVLVACNGNDNSNNAGMGGSGGGDAANAADVFSDATGAGGSHSAQAEDASSQAEDASSQKETGSPGAEPSEAADSYAPDVFSLETGAPGAEPEPDGSPSIDASVTFAAVAPIFSRCTACHTRLRPDGGTRTPLGNLDLASDPYGALVGIAAGLCPDHLYVAPGHPESSYLLNAVRGQFPPSSASCPNGAADGGSPMSRMPFNCSQDGGSVACLTDEQIAALATWIAEGAAH